MRLNDVAGYADAVARETFLRNAAFVPVPESVCGIECSPMTLGHLATLQAVGSPFVCGGAPSWQDVLAFFCVVSPHAGRPGTWKRRRFLARCKKLPFVITTDPPTFPAVDAIAEFCADAFADAPGGNGGKSSRNYYSLAAALVGLIAREYHWPEADILNLPLKRLWQYRQEIMASKGEAPILFNPSDKLVQRWLDKKAN